MKRTFVIGDIHGCFDEFIELMGRIGITDDDFILSLGDIVDRGNKSLEVYHFFKNRKNAKVLMGNHERKHLRGILSYSQEIVKVQFANEYKEFVTWLESLDYYYETEDAIIVHAFFEHDKSLQEQKEEVLAGTTSGSRLLESRYEEGKYWNDYYNKSKTIIYGHHVVGDSPKIQNNTIGIDTGACHGGMLTAIELPGFKVHQIKVIKDYWKEEQQKWQVPVLEAKNWEGMKTIQIFKQIDKLKYKQDAETRRFFENLNNWIHEIDNTIEQIMIKIHELAREFEDKFNEDFNKEVSKLKYRTLIFKAKSNKLDLINLKKTLDTPKKVIELATQLNIKEIPKRKAGR